VEYFEARGKLSGAEAKPFFLYVAFTAPHTPWVPMEQFRGKSMGGLYGDFVAQVDDAVGQVLAAMEKAGCRATRWSSSPATTGRCGIPLTSRSSVTPPPAIGGA